MSLLKDACSFKPIYKLLQLWTAAVSASGLTLKQMGDKCLPTQGDVHEPGRCYSLRQLHTVDSTMKSEEALVSYSILFTTAASFQNTAVQFNVMSCQAGRKYPCRLLHMPNYTKTTLHIWLHLKNRRQ